MPAIHYRTENLGGLDIFYRDAGREDAPAVMLLHGFPTSSHMFRNLIPVLAEHHRVIAPDFPGFGFSAMPRPDEFTYGFESIARLIDGLLDRLGLGQYALYIMDYGAPVGLRIALRHPERVRALVIQNGNAYEDGLKDFWKLPRALWAENNTTQSRDALRSLLTIDGTKFQYLDGVRDASRIDPSAWLHDQCLLDRPGNDEIQLDLMYDYRTNLPLYPDFQAYFREYQPPALIVWGANDQIFPADGARAYLRDLPDAELHLFDTGHFALEDKGDEIIPLIRDFLGRVLLA